MPKLPKRPPAKPGRPPLGDRSMSHALTIRFPEAMMTEIERLMATRMDAPDKGAIVRELVAEALQARLRR